MLQPGRSSPAAFLAVCLLCSTSVYCGDPLRFNTHDQSFLATGDDFGDQPVSKSEEAEEQLPAAHTPAFEIIIARYSEDLHWISSIPDTWDVVVLNKVRKCLAQA